VLQWQRPIRRSRHTLDGANREPGVDAVALESLELINITMKARSHYLVGANTEVEVVREDIKNFHIGVYPPLGRIRVAVPTLLDDEAVRLAVIGRLSWIKCQRQSFADQNRQTSRDRVEGESDWYQRRR